MRVLHVAAGNLYGGIETVLVTLARCRDLAPDVEPHYALCFDGRLSQELRATGVAVHALGAVRVSRPWTVRRARRALGALLARAGFDLAIVHGCWPHALFAPVAREQGICVVFWAHAAPAGWHWLERWSSRTRPELVIANSRFTAGAMTRLFPGVRTEVLYSPVVAADVGHSVRRRVRALLAAPVDAAVIVMASRLEPCKGHDLLIAALACMRDNPTWVVWIAGGAQRPHEARYLKALQASVARQGLKHRVHFLGQRADVPDLLAAADIHCQPNSGPETFGVAFIEALNAGLPVVTTAMGAAREIVDASCGCFVQPSPESLATTLLQLVADPAQRMRLGSNGPARARLLCEPAARMQEMAALLATAGARHSEGPRGAPPGLAVPA